MDSIEKKFICEFLFEFVFVKIYLSPFCKLRSLLKVVGKKVCLSLFVTFFLLLSRFATKILMLG
jgi:uncharacterized MAPEG superfamily protein